MNRPSAARAAVPAREKAAAAIAAVTAIAGPWRQRRNAAASTAAAPMAPTAKAQAGAHASGQAMISRPKARLMRLIGPGVRLGASIGSAAAGAPIGLAGFWGGAGSGSWPAGKRSWGVGTGSWGAGTRFWGAGTGA